MGSVDFNKCCEEIMGTVLPRIGIAIRYNDCPGCGFMFTSDFDAWSQEDFRRHIYNDDYWIVDPDYVSLRPRTNERQLTNVLTPAVHANLLDYGGGNGLLAAKLRRHGFAAETYDPFNPKFASKPSGKFAVVTCFETLEHVPDVKAAMRGLASLLAEGGIIIFSTLLRRSGSAEDGLDWWYVGPRNGHVSICTEDTLRRAWGEIGFQVGSANEYLHLAWKAGSPLLTSKVRDFFKLVDAPAPARFHARATADADGSQGGPVAV